MHYFSFQLKIAYNKFVDQNSNVIRHLLTFAALSAILVHDASLLSLQTSPVPGGATGNGSLWTNERREDVCVTNHRLGRREDSSEDLLGPGQADNGWELSP